MSMSQALSQHHAAQNLVHPALILTSILQHHMKPDSKAYS